MKTMARVVVASNASLHHSSEIYRGVVDFASRAQLGWQFLPLGHDFETRVTELKSAGAIDGVVGTFVSDRWLEDLGEAGVAAVNLFSLSDIRSVPTVTIDDRELGAAAARHLIEQGAQSFVCVGSHGGFDRRQRLAGFADALQRAVPEWREALQVLESGPQMRERLEGLRRGATRLGVFGLSDRQAREFILRAGAAGLGRVGDEVLVVGVDDDPSESIFAGIGLSSFSIPAYACGWKAAEQLAAWMGGKTGRPEVHHVAGWKLMPRESSLRPGRPRAAERLAGYLRDHMAWPELNMDSAARVLGQSRRNLEAAFRESFGESPYRWLTQLRIERARQLLETTQLKIQDVGWRCGFGAQHHFSATFRKHVGTSPRDYRKSCQR